MTGPPTQPGGPRPPAVDLQRVAIGAGAAMLVLAVAALAFGAARLSAPVSEQVRQDVGDSGWRRHAPEARSHEPDRAIRHLRELRALRDLRSRGPVERRLDLHEITISAIAGSNVTLSTQDGWTRTIVVTDATTITRAGATITLADLKVGDEVRFHQTRNDDGSYTVSAIDVILPKVVGEVTATTADSITIERRDGTTMTIHVGSGTTYHVRGVANATLVDIGVGMLIAAQGTQNADGSLEAVAVFAAAKR